ncbi:hypothetical protein Ndes2526B_g07373 [Nannochloris sp. 'desiccata']
MAHILSVKGAQAFMSERLAMLQTAQVAVVKGIRSGNFQVAYDLPEDVISTVLGTVILTQLLLMLATRGGRSFIFKTVDTILALIFLLVIIVVVLGLPTAVFFLSYKALAFLLGSFMQIETVEKLVATASRLAGRTA